MRRAFGRRCVALALVSAAVVAADRPAQKHKATDADAEGSSVASFARIIQDRLSDVQRTAHSLAQRVSEAIRGHLATVDGQSTKDSDKRKPKTHEPMDVFRFHIDGVATDAKVKTQFDMLKRRQETDSNDEEEEAIISTTCVCQIKKGAVKDYITDTVLLSYGQCIGWKHQEGHLAWDASSSCPSTCTSEPKEDEDFKIETQSFDGGHHASMCQDEEATDDGNVTHKTPHCYCLELGKMSDDQIQASFQVGYTDFATNLWAVEQLDECYRKCPQYCQDKVGEEVPGFCFVKRDFLGHFDWASDPQHGVLRGMSSKGAFFCGAFCMLMVMVVFGVGFYFCVAGASPDQQQHPDVPAPLVSPRRDTRTDGMGPSASGTS